MSFPDLIGVSQLAGQRNGTSASPWPLSSRETMPEANPAPPGSSSIQNDQEECEISTTYLAVTHNAKRLSCACWDDATQTLLLGEFSESETEGFATLQKLKHQLKPQTIVCCSSASESLMDAATKPLIGSAHQYPISTLTNISFSVERGRQKLLGLGATVNSTIDVSAGG